MVTLSVQVRPILMVVGLVRDMYLTPSPNVENRGAALAISKAFASSNYDVR